MWDLPSHTFSGHAFILSDVGQGRFRCSTNEAACTTCKDYVRRCLQGNTYLELPDSCESQDLLKLSCLPWYHDTISQQGCNTEFASATNMYCNTVLYYSCFEVDGVLSWRWPRWLKYLPKRSFLNCSFVVEYGTWLWIVRENVDSAVQYTLNVVFPHTLLSHLKKSKLLFGQGDWG